MKYLRTTMWFGRKNNANPMTSIICEQDLRVSVYTAANEQRAMSGVMMGPPVEVEIHEMPDELTREEAVMCIIRDRSQPMSFEEHLRHTMFDWAMDLLERMKPGDVAQTTQPSPLDYTTVTTILLRVAASPKYQNQTINIVMADRTEVSLVGGIIVTSQPT